MTNNFTGKVNIANLVFEAETKAKEGVPNNKIDTEKEETIFRQALEELKQTEHLSDDDINEIWNIALSGVTEQSDIEAKKVTDAAETSETTEVAETENVNETQNYAAQTNNSPVVNLDKNQKKMRKTEALADILKAIEKQSPLDWEALKGAVKVELGVLADEPYYQQLLGEVNTIIDKMKDVDFNSREDVENLYKTTYAGLKELPNNEFKSFRKDVLNNLIRAAEKEQMKKEKDQVLDKYNALRSSGKTREEAMAEIRNTFKGSYFSDYSGHDITEINYPSETEKLFKGVISLMEAGEVMTEARNEVWDAIYSLKNNPEATNYSDAKKLLKQKLTPESGKIDKYVQKVLDGERTLSEKLNAEQSITKAYIKKVTTDNSVEKLKRDGVNEKYFTDELKNDALFEAFKKKGLVVAKKTEDGKPVLDKDGNQVYDLTALSDLIRDQLGANSKADKQLTEMKALSELQQTLEKTLAKIDNNYTKLSTKDTKRLIKLCGFPVEGKNWWKITMDALDKTFTMGLMSTAGALVTPREVVRGTVSDVVSGVTTGDIPISIEINDTSKTTLNLSFTGGGDISLKDYMSLAKQVQAQGGTITSWKDFQQSKILQVVIDNSKNPNSTQVIEGILTDKSLPFSQEYSKDYAKKAGNKTKWNAVLNTMLFSLATNFLMSALNYEKAEKPMIETQFKETNLEEYEKRLDASKTLSANYKEGLKYLAHAFKDADGNWDVESYKQLLNRIAGDGGILNRAELEIGIFEAKKELEKKLQEKPADTTAAQKETTSPSPVKQEQETPVADVKAIEEAKAENPVEEVKVETKPADDVKFFAVGDINMKNSNKYYWEEIIQKFYGPALEAGISMDKIRFKLREVNNKMLNNYKAIPPNLLIPEDLFGDGKCIRTDEKPDSEIKMRSRQEETHPTVKAHQTPNAKWRGGSEYTDANGEKKTERYDKSYNTREEALKAAEEEYKRGKTENH